VTENIETVIIGGGQAGLALSYFLTKQGREHIIFEKAAWPAEAWRNHRWDSFTLVTPNWNFQLPGAEYDGAEPGAYMPRAEIVQRFERYVSENDLPVRYSTEASRVEPLENGLGYRVRAGERSYTARKVVIATGLYQSGKTPDFAAQIFPDIQQIDSGEYRNPQALPPGAVLVVGSGQSGCQIAEELNQAGRKVYLSTGATGRVPRRYRGQDIVHWLTLTGFFDRTPDKLPSPRARFAGNPQVTGKGGGHNLNLHQFYRDGMILLGRIQGREDGRLLFAADLRQNLAKSDKIAADIIRMVDGYITQTGIDAPVEEIMELADGYNAPEVPALDLRQAGIGTIIWAIGQTFDYSMVKLPVVDDFGFPVTSRGVTRFPGLYFLGMPWLYKQKSGLLCGVGEDAAYLADHIRSAYVASGS
jgi:putative flavoprotein involved in K+ transport